MGIALRLSSAAIALSLVVLSATVLGHHSMSEYDRGVVTEFEGEVLRVSWRNPHILLEVSTGEGGQETVWFLEGSAVSAQRRRGVTGGLIEVGDRVRVAGAPSTRRAQHMLVDHVLLPNGVELLVGGVREPRWSDSSVGGSAWTVDPEKAATAQGQGIFRVWSRDVSTWYFRPPEAYRLTEGAAAAAAQWDEFEDNPLLDCTPPGMPGLMGNPYPMEFVEVDGNIELRFEEFDVVRTIHLGGGAQAANVALSPLGYSVGHWEDDTLVVQTSRINWPYFDRVGLPQSEDVEIQERFTAVEGGDALEYELTVTDPQTLLEPFIWHGRWAWRPGEEVNRYECTL